MFFPMPHPASWTNSKHPLSTIIKLVDGQLIDPKPAWVNHLQTVADIRAEEAEAAAREAAARIEREELEQEYIREMDTIVASLPEFLKRQGLFHLRPEWERKLGRYVDKIDYCAIDFAYYDANSYYCHVDTANLPHGVSIPKFRDPGISETLTQNLGSNVNIEINNGDHKQRPGVWIIVDHKAGKGLIPNHVEYGRMFKSFPKFKPNKKPFSLVSFPVGITYNNQGVYFDYDDSPTLLVAGERGAGKSVFLHGQICSIIQKAPPTYARLFLTDLKGGLEFIDYQGIPHLGGDVDIMMRLKKGGELKAVRLGQRVLTEPYQVVPVLKYFEAEMARRQKLMLGKAKNILTYNNWADRYHKPKLSRWILIIDELATLSDSDKDIKLPAERSLKELVRKGRATGLYLTLAAQITDKTVLSPQLAGNMGARLVGHLGNGSTSGLCLGDGSWDATRLPPELHGRMIARWGTKHTVQVPFISEMTIKRIINAVKNGAVAYVDELETTDLAQELFEFALINRDGECTRDTLYAAFRSRLSKNRIEKILNKFQVSKDDDGFWPVITIHDEDYYLLPTNITTNGSLPRRLITTDNFETKKEEFINLIAVARRPSPSKNGQQVHHENLKPVPIDQDIFVYDPGEQDFENELLDDQPEQPEPEPEETPENQPEFEPVGWWSEINQ